MLPDPSKKKERSQERKKNTKQSSGERGAETREPSKVARSCQKGKKRAP